MKNILLLGLLLSFLASCKNEEKKDALPFPGSAEGKTMGSGAMAARSCYQYVAAGDTFTLKITVIGERLVGSLDYNFAQKDDSKGSLAGTYANQAFFADYTFTSEGRTSVREVAFKRIGGVYVEGTGEMKELNGKMVFVDRNAITYDSPVKFITTACTR